MPKLFPKKTYLIQVVGGGGVPPGAAVMTDSLLFSAVVNLAETIGGQADVPTYIINASYAETIASAIDAAIVGVKLLDTMGVLTDQAGIIVQISDAVAAQLETAKMSLTGFADTIAGQAETLKVGASGSGLADSIAGKVEGMTLSVLYTATGTFIVPAGITSVTVECRGGGKGGAAGSATTGGTGGNGGDYAKSVLVVTPAATLTVTVGAATAAGAVGNDSWFNTATTIRAKGGGSANTTIGTTTFTGGVGAAGVALGTGGGGGGTLANGSNAVGATAGAGGNAGGGTGGNGATTAGLPGVAPGGGGGGGGGSATSPGAASIGARGAVQVTWTAA